MECPKCGGGCLLSEEELVKVLEERSAREVLRAIIKATYVCRACSEKFSRLFVDDLGKRKKPPEKSFAPSSPPATQEYQPSDPAEGLKFF